MQSGDLYYRYAKDGEFGVASVDTSGTTTELISETDLGYQNHLNFAFDVLTTGDGVYGVCDRRCGRINVDNQTSRTSAGVETTIFTDTQDLADLTHVGRRGGGAYLGCHECFVSR